MPKQRLHPSHIAWPCVILAVDPGAATGAALVVSRPHKPVERVRVGAVPAGTEGEWVELACEVAIRETLPLVVVAETWTLGRGGHERMGQAAMVGLAAAWGRWAFRFDEAGQLLRDAGLFAVRTIRVNASTWHARMLGGDRGVKSTEWKRRARARCERVHGVADLTDDAAEALIIAEWACRAGEVGKVLPAGVLKTHGVTPPAKPPTQRRLA